MPRTHALLIALVVALGLPAVAPRLAQAFFPVTHVAIAEHMPEPTVTLLRQQPAAFAYGAMFPDLEGIPTQPSLWRDLYRGMNPADTFVPVGVRLHSLALALDLVRLAETEEELAFAIGFLAHVAADTVSHNHYVAQKLSRHGVAGLDASLGETVVEAMADAALHKANAGVAHDALRNHTPECWYFLYRVISGAPWNATISPEAFQGNVGMWENMLGTIIDGSAPDGPIVSAIRGLGRIVRRELVEPDEYADIDDALALAAVIAQDWLTRGFDSPWAANEAWGHASHHAMQAAAVTAGHARGNPGLILLDAVFISPDGERADRAAPDACAGDRDGDDVAGMRSFTARASLAAWRAMEGHAVLIVEKDWRGRDRTEVARAAVAIRATQDEIDRGRTWTVETDFTWDARADGPWNARGFGRYVRGFTLRLVFIAGLAPDIADGATVDASELDVRDGVACFDAAKPFEVVLFGRSTYDSFPFGLDVDPGLPSRATTARNGNHHDGRANIPSPYSHAATRPDDPAYAPYAWPADMFPDLPTPASALAD